MKGLIVIIAGPTGVGESTVTKELLKIYKNSTRIVTYTSRPKRLNEKNHIDYHFLSKKQFLEAIKKKQFLEYSHINNRDHYYGTKKEDFKKLLNQGKIIFFNCDLPGLKGIKKSFPNQNISLFINYERPSQVKTRLLKREPDMDPQTLKMRLTNANQEMKDRHLYDYVIVNKQNQLKNTVKRAKKLIDKKIQNNA